MSLGSPEQTTARGRVPKWSAERAISMAWSLIEVFDARVLAYADKSCFQNKNRSTSYKQSHLGKFATWFLYRIL
jgi:hypothetical protein